MSDPGGFQPSFRITHRMMAGLTRIERARGFLEAARLSEDWLATMRSRAFLLEAHHTTHIEGTRLTLEQAERLLAGEAVAGTDPDDARELLNYRDAFAFVSSYLNDGGPVTEGLIREIHRRLVVGVRGGSAAPGEYRRVQNYVVNSVTQQIIYTPWCTSIRSWTVMAGPRGCCLRSVCIGLATTSSDCSRSVSTMTAIGRVFTRRCRARGSRGWT
jgi:Fic family protein